jgi:PAS domain-containing protein
VKATNFFGIGSILKGKKKVLWVSARETLDYPLSSDLLGYVAFRSLHDGIIDTVLLSDVLVLSLDAESASACTDLTQFIGNNSSSVKILLLTGYVTKNAIPDELFHLINKSHFEIFYFDGFEPRSFEEVLRQAISLSEKRRSRKDVLGRTESLSRSKIEIENQVQQTKALVRFVKGLTAVVSVDDIMALIQSEIKSFQRVKPPILAYAPGPKNLLLVFSQGAQFAKKTIVAVWPQQNKIRLNDKKDSQFLADIFGRPFGKLMTIPLQLRRKTAQDPLQVSAVLFFEHALGADEVDPFLAFFQERLQPLGIAFDRLLLEQDLTEASLLWERTFDGLQEPVVIFDSEGQILRANKSFTENLGDVPHADLHTESLRHKDHYYEVHSYPIVSGAHYHTTSIINHYVDVTISHRLQKQMIQNEKWQL